MNITERLQMVADSLPPNTIRDEILSIIEDFPAEIRSQRWKGGKSNTWYTVGELHAMLQGIGATTTQFGNAIEPIITKLLPELPEECQDYAASCVENITRVLENSNNQMQNPKILLENI